MTAPSTTLEPERNRDLGPLPALARGVFAVAAVKVVALVAVANVWGIHRDEFYYLAGGRRLDWGYVDHPPLTPLLYRVGDVVFGDSQLALHTIPALLAGVLVVVAAAMAREFGGGRRAQLITAVGVAVSPMFLTTAHFLSTVSVDILLWSIGLLLVARLLRTRDTKWWIPIGIVAAAGLLNKNTMLFWALGVLAGLVATRDWPLLRDPRAAAAVAIAALPMVPYLLWQIDNDWPTIEFLRSLQSHTDIISNPLLYLPFQLVLLGPVLAFVWIPGLLWLLRSHEARPFRAIGIGYIVVLLVVFVLRGKAYYVGSWYPALFAAGAVRIERLAPQRWRVWVAVLLVTSVQAIPFALPIVPASSGAGRFIASANGELGEMVGWDELADQVASVAHALPPDEQERLTILTENYSEAGAIEYWRSPLGLPQPISRQNSYWLWGFGPAHDNGTVIAVGYEPSELQAYFGDVRLVARVDNREDIDNKERGAAILLCRDQRVAWRDIWPALKDFS